MNLLTNDILAFLLSKRYMDFKTCSGLRLVSGQFNYHATKYFSSLKEFDLSILEKNFDWRSNSVEVPYACLLETVTEHCQNLEKVTGIRIRSDKQNSVSRICLQKLPKLTSIDIIDLALEPTVLFDFLKLLPHLRLVKVCIFDNSRHEDDKAVPEEKKLVVSELSLDRGDFWRIFRVDHLKKLEISVCMFITKENINTFFGVVGRGQRLEFLEVDIFVDNNKFFPPLLRLAEVLPHLKQVNFNLHTLSIESVAQIARQYPSFGKFVKKLTTYDPEPTGD